MVLNRWSGTSAYSRLQFCILETNKRCPLLVKDVSADAVQLSTSFLVVEATVVAERVPGFRPLSICFEQLPKNLATVKTEATSKSMWSSRGLYGRLL